MSEQKFPIGWYINKVISQRGKWKKGLARELGVSESTMMHLTSRKKLDAEFLQKLGNALKYNFFKHYPVEDETMEDLDKDKVIEELRAKVAGLEKQLEESKLLGTQYMMKGYEDLRRANELLLASLPNSAPRQRKAIRKNVFG